MRQSVLRQYNVSIFEEILKQTDCTCGKIVILMKITMPKIYFTILVKIIIEKIIVIIINKILNNLNYIYIKYMNL